MLNKTSILFDMKILYENETKHEGNDCMIYISQFIIEIQDEQYVANTITTYRGWFGTERRSETEIFDTYAEAYNFVQKDTFRLEDK